MASSSIGGGSRSSIAMLWSTAYATITRWQLSGRRRRPYANTEHVPKPVLPLDDVSRRYNRAVVLARYGIDGRISIGGGERGGQIRSIRVSRVPDQDVLAEVAALKALVERRVNKDGLVVGRAKPPGHHARPSGP